VKISVRSNNNIENITECFLFS